MCTNTGCPSLSSHYWAEHFKCHLEEHHIELLTKKCLSCWDSIWEFNSVLHWDTGKINRLWDENGNVNDRSDKSSSWRLEFPNKRQMSKIRHMYLNKSRYKSKWYTFVWNLYARTWVLEYVDTWKSEEGGASKTTAFFQPFIYFYLHLVPNSVFFLLWFPASVSWVPAWHILLLPSRHWGGWPVVLVCLGLPRFCSQKSHETPQSQSYQAGLLSQCCVLCIFLPASHSVPLGALFSATFWFANGPDMYYTIC